MDAEEKIVEAVLDFFASNERDSYSAEVCRCMELVEQLEDLAHDCRIERNAKICARMQERARAAR